MQAECFCRIPPRYLFSFDKPHLNCLYNLLFTFFMLQTKLIFQKYFVFFLPKIERDRHVFGKKYFTRQ